MQYPGGSFRLFCTKLGLLDPLGLPGNSIRTGKYTVLSFLPVNLFQQFTRVANMYFLFIAFLQLIPGLSPTSWVTTVGPLCFVLFINGIKVSSACSPSWSHACQASRKCQALLRNPTFAVPMNVTQTQCTHTSSCHSGSYLCLLHTPLHCALHTHPHSSALHCLLSTLMPLLPSAEQTTLRGRCDAQL